MLRIAPSFSRYSSISIRFQSTVSLESVFEQPVPKVGGRAQFWREPIYSGPYVHPLHKGPDYSVVGQTRPLATSKPEAERLAKQLELGKKVVHLLKEIKLTEDLYQQQCTKVEALEKERTKWIPKQKAVEDIC